MNDQARQARLIALRLVDRAIEEVIERPMEAAEGLVVDDDYDFVVEGFGGCELVVAELKAIRAEITTKEASVA